MISKSKLAAWLLLPLGLALLIVGALRIHSVRNATPLEELDAESCRLGRYVRGTITDFAVILSPNLGNGVYKGDSIHYMPGVLGTEYSIFTIRMQDGCYITAMLENESLLAQLDRYEQGRGDDAVLLGKLVRRRFDLNYEWYKDAFGTTDTAEIDRLVYADCTIREVAPEYGKPILYAGMLCLLLFCLAQLDLSIRERVNVPPVYVLSTADVPEEELAAPDAEADEKNSEKHLI